MIPDSQKYIDAGRLLVVKPDNRWKKDLKRINRHKNGHPFVYSDRLFAVLAVIKSMTGRSYMNLEGLCREALGEDCSPDHSTIHARIQNLDMSFDDGIATIRMPNNNRMRMAIDSTGMTPSRRGESIREKWDVKRGFFKLHIIADENHRILSAKLTGSGSGSGDALHLVELLDDALDRMNPEVCEKGERDDKQDKQGKSANADMVEILGDGAYGSRKNVKECMDRNIIPTLRINVNSTTYGKGYGDGWGDLVRRQLGNKSETGKVHTNSLSQEKRRANQREWMKDTGYGKRWCVETVFSSLKRIQGEFIWSRKTKYIQQEIRIRVAVHNMMMNMGVHA